MDGTDRSAHMRCDAMQENFFWGDAIALALVGCGFAVYQLFSREGRAARLGHGDGAARKRSDEWVA